MSELISKQAAIDAVMDEFKRIPTNAIRAKIRIEALPPAQPAQHIDEWCTDCKEYDKERHCCPRWNKVIRQALADAQPEQRTGKCKWCERLKERNLRIEYYWIDQEGCTASFSEPHIVATGIAKFCPNCGAKITEGDAE